MRRNNKVLWSRVLVFAGGLLLLTALVFPNNVLFVALADMNIGVVNERPSSIPWYIVGSLGVVLGLILMRSDKKE